MSGASRRVRADRITGATVGGADAWVMLGHVYFDRVVFRQVPRILEQVYAPARDCLEAVGVHLPRPHQVLRHGDPPLPGRRHPRVRFGRRAAQLRPPLHGERRLRGLRSHLATLGCRSRTSATSTRSSRASRTCRATSPWATEDAAEYVYRHPGIGTEKIVDRSAEFAGLRLAARARHRRHLPHGRPRGRLEDLALRARLRNLDVTRAEELEQAAMEMDRALHTSGTRAGPLLRLRHRGPARTSGLLKAFGPIDVPGYFELRDKVLRLKAFADADGFDKVPSHNDFFPPNFLVDQGRKDQPHRLGVRGHVGHRRRLRHDDRVHGGDDPRARGRRPGVLPGPYAPSEREARHFFAYEVFAGWCWYLWALVKEAEGDDVGEWLYIYYSPRRRRTLDSLLAAYAQAASSTQLSDGGELA